MDTNAYLIVMREKNMDVNKVHLTPSDNDSQHGQKATQNKIIIKKWHAKIYQYGKYFVDKC